MRLASEVTVCAVSVKYSTRCGAWARALARAGHQQTRVNLQPNFSTSTPNRRQSRTEPALRASRGPMAVILHTNLGLITIDLYVKERPQTARNFIKLCKAKYYNNCLFFNIQSDFIVQTGDPTNTGRGGTSLNGLLYGPQVRNQPAILHSLRFHVLQSTAPYSLSLCMLSSGRSLTSLAPQAHFFNDEMKPALSHKLKGTVAMASKGENQNASQFYITTVDGTSHSAPRLGASSWSHPIVHPFTHFWTRICHYKTNTHHMQRTHQTLVGIRCAEAHLHPQA